MTAVNLSENLSGFADAAQASSYAVQPLNWAVGSGIINGDDGLLKPQGTATRAQTAQILMRYMGLTA